MAIYSTCKFDNFVDRLSLVRIIIWAFVGFMIINLTIGYLIPPKPEKSEKLNMATTPGDPRIVHRSFQYIPDITTVAWITDSSPIIVNPKGAQPNNKDYTGLIHDIIQDQKPYINGYPLRFVMYMPSFGPKALDKYFETQHAVTLKPNLLLYSVNPTFDFTPWYMLEEETTPGSLASFGSTRSLKWSLLFASPSQILQGNLMRIFPVVERRFELASFIENLRHSLDPFGLAKIPALNKKAGSRHLMFWRAYYQNLNPPSDDRISTQQRTQLIAMRLMDISDRSWGKLILSDLVQDLRDTKTPALIYMIPVNLKAISNDPVAAPKFEALEQWFLEFAKNNSDENITSSPVPLVDF